MITFLYFTAIFFFILLCALLCLVVLLQESKSSGLGASFGGEATDSLFGTATADILKKLTAWLGAIFLVACVLLSIWTAAMGRSRPTQEESYIENGTVEGVAKL
jgi:preprotein translocase subunit SecG